MRNKPNIHAENTDRSTGLPVSRLQRPDSATGNFVCTPARILPFEIQVMLMTEAQAARALNIPVEDLRMERERGAISFRYAAKNIRYTQADLLEYIENIRMRSPALHNTQQTHKTICTINKPFK